MVHPEVSKTSHSIQFVAAGDVMLGDHPVVIGHGVRSLLEKRGADFAFEHVREILRRADITFGNLEAILSDVGLNRKLLQSVELRGSPEFASSLSRAGFDVMALANNHILQHGLTAYDETVDLLMKERIQVAGRTLPDSEFHSDPVWFDKDGIRIAILGYSMRPEKYYPSKPIYAIGTETKITEDIGRIREKAHNVIVSLHWGDEYINRPSLERIKLGRRLIDAGVDIVVGHHPHVLQGVEEYHHGLIAYSLGNFVLDMWQGMMRESMILKCELTEEGLKSFEYIPCFINAFYQPVPLKGSEEEELRLKIDKWSTDLKAEDLSNSELKDRRYASEMKRNLLKYRLECYLYFVSHFWKYRPSMYMQSLRRALLRRFSGEGEGILYG